MKKLSTLLVQRQALLRKAHLANLAFAYRTLKAFAERIARARLAGRVLLRPAAPEAERYWASLTALDGNQSVIEEHFADDELMELADVIAFTTGKDEPETAFRLEELAELFLVPVQRELEREGIAIDSCNSERDAVC